MRLVKPRPPLLRILLAGSVLLMAVPAAHAASPRLDLRQPLSAGPPGQVRGVPATAPSPGALARSLAVQTGLTPAQVTAVDVCGAPGPGRAACAAQTLVLRSDNARVHPRVHAGRLCLSVADLHRRRHQYTIASTDIGAILRVRETAVNAGGTTAAWSAQYVGPVASAGSASAVLLAGQAVLRNAAGTPLAVAQVTAAAAMSSDAIVGGHARRGALTGRVVRVRRAARIRGRLRAWVCPVGAARGGAPPACTRQFSLGASTLVRLPASMTGRVRIVVVRRGR
jgi:hypothetical protein